MECLPDTEYCFRGIEQQKVPIISMKNQNTITMKKVNKGKWIGICGGVARNTNPGREAAAQNQHIHPAPTN